MNIIIKENYLKLSKRADYNNNVMRITHLDNKNDPISITHGFIFNTVEIRNGNYYLKPNANLVFKCKSKDVKKFLNDFELENEKIKSSIAHLDHKLTSKSNTVI